MRKRGELSMEFIVIAAIALLVLVILTVFVLKWAGIFDKSTECEGLGGQCATDCASITDDQGNAYVQRLAACTEDTDLCCVPFGSAEQG